MTKTSKTASAQFRYWGLVGPWLFDMTASIWGFLCLLFTEGDCSHTCSNNCLPSLMKKVSIKRPPKCKHTFLLLPMTVPLPAFQLCSSTSPPSRGSSRTWRPSSLPVTSTPTPPAVLPTPNLGSLTVSCWRKRSDALLCRVLARLWKTDCFNCGANEHTLTEMSVGVSSPMCCLQSFTENSD